MLVLGGEGHLLERAVEVPVLLRGIEVADDLDVTHVTAAEALLVREADELAVGHRIHAHELRGDRVDRDLIVGREDHVLRIRDHAARAGAVTGERSVHDREDSLVDLLLDHEEVDEGLVDDRVRPVAVLVQKTAERVLHRAGSGREDVRLDRREVDDVLADEPLRDREALRIDLVEAEELLPQVTDRVTDVDPVLALVEVGRCGCRTC